MPDPATEPSSRPTSGLSLPAYILMRPEGVFVKLAPPPAPDILQLFVDRLFTNGARFSGLDYACFMRLLYGDPAKLYPGDGNEIRLASDIVRFSKPRQELYKGVKISPKGELAEYMFEPPLMEVITDEPVYGPPGDDGVAPVVEHLRKTETRPTQLDFDEFVTDMWLKGVRFGIAAEAVREVIRKNAVMRMNIASQVEPTASKDAELREENEFLHRDDAPTIMADGKADLRRAKNRFPQVAKNAPLLRKIQRVLGEPGHKVTGAIIEPRLPLDIDLNRLAGEGTRIETTKDGELIVSAIDGFLYLDDDTHQVMVTEKIENRGGISAKSTGDIRLNVEEFIEHGEVQERRTVEGKHMIFHSHVFGTILSKNGNITLRSNLSGGRAQSVGGNITLNGRAISAIMEARDGTITAEFAENCVIIGKTVILKRAVNCAIVAEELRLGIAEGCGIAGKKIQLDASNSRRDSETVISVLLPDILSYDQQITAAKARLVEAQAAFLEKKQAIIKTQSDDGFAKYQALADRIRTGTIKLSTAQEAEWQKVVNKYAPVVRDSDALMKICQGLESEIDKLTAARAACGAGEFCRLVTVVGETVVRKLKSNLGLAYFYTMTQQELTTQLHQLGIAEERLFTGNHGSFDWHYEAPQPASVE
ncbi:MAG: flagellar assembly protein A [Pseudomonadota bacterium]